MEIKTNLGTHYLEVSFTSGGGDYVMEIKTLDGIEGIAISKEFFDAAMKEFGDKNASI